MLSAQTAAVITGGGGVRRRRFAGFSAFAGLAGTVSSPNGLVDVATLQRALNAAYSPSGTVLDIDGVIGTQTRARIVEFKQQIGYPANSTVDVVLLTALGVTAGGLPGATVTGSVQPLQQGYFDINDRWVPATGIGNGELGTGGYGPGVANLGEQGSNSPIYDALTLKGLRDLLTTEGVAAAKASAQNLMNVANATKETTNAALKFLADNGDLIAKGALALGVSYAVMTAIGIGGGGLLLIMLLKKR